MATSGFLGPSPYDSDLGNADYVENFFSLILTLARMEVSTNLGPLDSDDIAQEALLKLWLISRRQFIASPKAYIRKLVHSVVIDMLRKYKAQQYQALPMDEDGELQEGHLMVSQSLEFGNPESILEQHEELDELMEELMQALSDLKPRQQQAAVCTLKSRVDDLLEFVEALQANDIDSEVQWPATKVDRQRLQASYAPAMRNMACHMHACKKKTRVS